VPKVWLISDSGSSAKNSEMRPMKPKWGPWNGWFMVRVGVIILAFHSKVAAPAKHMDGIFIESLG